MSTSYVSSRELFSAPVVTKVIKQIATPYDRLQRFFGLTMESNTVEERRGRDFAWDIMNPPRTLAQVRSPISGPASRAPIASSMNFARCPRLHEKVTLLDDMVYNQRQLGQGPDMVDRSGQAYVARQQNMLAQRFKNAREFMVSRLFKGGFGVTVSGQDWSLSEKGGGSNVYDVDYKLPASNQDQLNINGDGACITGTWATLTQDVAGDCAKINAAAQKQDGRPIRHAWTTTSLFMDLIANNTKLQAQGGSANTFYQSYERSSYRGPDGSTDTGFDIVLRAIPWLTWHLYDAVLDVGGTLSPVLDTDHVAFCPDPSPDWVGGFNGSEMVRENVTQSSTERFGFHAYTEPRTQPAGTELIAVDNFMPVLYVPACIKYAKVRNF